MRVIWLFCFVFIQVSVNINCIEEFVTIWAPKKVYDEKDYNVVVLPTDVDKRTEIAFQFRKSYGTITLHSEAVQKIKVKNTDKSGSKKDFELFMTLHRNETTSVGQRQMCMTQTLHKIVAEKKQFYSFIQLDKPIYKPSDNVRFRVVVVDRDLKPFHMNNININITDSLDRPIKEFTDLEEMYNGVFTGKFELDKNTPLGIWKIRVIIDKIEQWEIYKEFAVSKYTLPPFAAYIDIKDEHLLTNSIVRLSFSAKYSFEDFVRGNAQLSIKCTSTGQVVLTKSFTDITGIHLAKYKVHEELKAITTTKLDYEATLVFTEPQSGISANKTVKFTVHADDSPKIDANHPDKFMPGLPFYTKVFVYDWRDKLILNTPERVKVSLECVLQDGTFKTIMIDGEIKRGVAIINTVIPETADRITVKIKYLQVTYEKVVEKGAVVIGVNKIVVDYLPKSPDYGDNVNIFVRADSELDQLIAIVMSRHGNIESHKVPCHFKINCNFNITIRKDMMPEAKVVVYYVKDRKSMYQGETKIITTELGRNTLNVTHPASVETKTKVDISISTKPDSTVFLLGYDERLSYLFQGNEIKKEDVVKELADYDGSNEVKVFHIRKTNWHECTTGELERISKGRHLVTDHGGDEFTADQGEEDEVDDIPSERNPDTDPSPAADDVRHDFREVFLFEEIEVADGEFTKSFNVPDSITSWMISSFSMNSDFGLAIGQPTKLTVKNQFFMKMILPYSIRFKERLRVDVMVYNYVNTKENLDVTVSLFNIDSKNDIRFYDNECGSAASTNTRPTKTVSVPYDNARKVSFDIASGADRTKFEQSVRIRADASATTRHGTRYVDKILKRLKVEPIGVKTYDIESKSYNLRPANEPIRDNIQKNVTNADEYPKFIVEISGDYLTDDMNSVRLGYELYPNYCLEQRTSVLKGNVEHLRYLKSKNPNPSTTHFSSYYQSLLDQRTRGWNYATSSGYRAYFIEAIATAMEIGALPINRGIIERELNALRGYQTGSGNFNNFGSIPDSRSEYFRTAYILIPFLKFKKLITTNYEDVIRRGFNYLDGIHAVSGSDKEAYSVAALAYALRGDHNKAQNLLNEVEKDVFKIDNNRKCFKLSKSQGQSQAGCNLRHTSYAAIAYLTMNKFDSAKALITYILSQYKLNARYCYTYAFAISTEAISKFLIARTTATVTDFTVTLTNEMNFNRVVHITAANQKDPVEVIYPDYTLSPSISMKGSGFCSITKIFESTVALEQTSSKFSLTVTPLAATGTNMRTVRICGTYQPNEDEIAAQTLFNVIYDVEMPSGYTYTDIVNLSSKPEIKLAAPRQGRTRLQIYYNDYERNKQYCVDVKTTKFFEVKDVQNAGVMVYDYNDKKNVAIEFYKFSNSC